MDINNLNSFNNETILNSNLNNHYPKKYYINSFNQYNQLDNHNSFKSLKVNQLYLALINILGLIILKKALYDN
tara:strand:+ start:470 stop:688 length:219 start_codon:yes stop_codon:yes gene_type:complete